MSGIVLVPTWGNSYANAEQAIMAFNANAEFRAMPFGSHTTKKELKDMGYVWAKINYNSRHTLIVDI